MRTNDMYEWDWYSILHVKPTATHGEIKKAWLRMQKAVHPDKGHTASDDEADFRTQTSAQVNKAWEILGNPKTRALYDAYRVRSAEEARRTHEQPRERERPKEHQSKSQSHNHSRERSDHSRERSDHSRERSDHSRERSDRSRARADETRERWTQEREEQRRQRARATYEEYQAEYVTDDNVYLATYAIIFLATAAATGTAAFGAASGTDPAAVTDTIRNWIIWPGVLTALALGWYHRAEFHGAPLLSLLSIVIWPILTGGCTGYVTTTVAQRYWPW